MVTILGAGAGVTVNLGEGSDTATVKGGQGIALEGGDMGASDTIVFDISALMAPTTGATFGQDGTSGLVTGLGPIADATFGGFEQADFLLGGNSDELTIDQAVPGLSSHVQGGGGDDTIIVERIGGPTLVSGDGGIDTLRMVIPGAPTAPVHANLISDLQFDVESLIVDNAANTDPVDWQVRSGKLSGNGADVLFTDGAGEVRIIGGSNADTLTFDDQSRPVDATVDGDTVVLQLGDVVLASGGFSTFANFANVMDFGDLTGAENPYGEDDFALESSGSIGLDTSVGAAAAPGDPGDTFTFGAADGSAFTLYSLSLASSDGMDHDIVFSGTTRSGGSVEKMVTVLGDAGFQTFELPSDFTYLADVSWTPGATSSTTSPPRRSSRRPPPGPRSAR